jgi:hypothetical protein
MLEFQTLRSFSKKQEEGKPVTLCEPRPTEKPPGRRPPLSARDKAALKEVD